MYEEFIHWAKGKYPQFTFLTHEDAKSNERWLQWMVEDINPVVAPPAPSYRNGMSNPTSVNIANQKIQGRVESETLDLGLFTKNSNALWATREALRKKSFPTATLTVKLNRDAFQLQPGDVFKFSFAPYGIEDMVFRLARVDEENLESETISITAEEEYSAVSEAQSPLAEPEDYSPPPASDYVGGTLTNITQEVTVTEGEPVLLPVADATKVVVETTDGTELIEGVDYDYDRENGVIEFFSGEISYLQGTEFFFESGGASLTLLHEGITYLLDEDYTYDAETGLITFLDDGRQYHYDSGYGTLTTVGHEGAVSDGNNVVIKTSATEGTVRRFIEVPYAFGGEEIQVLPIVTRPNQQNIGYEIYFSADGESYSFLKREETFSIRGELAEDYPTTFQIDDTHGLKVTFLGDDVEMIESITRVELLGKSNLALIEGELITFQNIEPLWGRVYRLTGVYRGRFNTNMVHHSKGTEFVYLSSSEMNPIKHSELTVGATRYFKAVQFSPNEAETLDLVPAQELTIEGEAFKPYPPANVIVNGEALHPEYADDGLSIAWASRYRGRGAGSKPPDVGDTAPAREAPYVVRLLVDGVVKYEKKSVLEMGYVCLKTDLEAAGCYGDDIEVQVSALLRNEGIDYESRAVSVMAYYHGS
jgi:hypothetical protein